MCGLGENLAFRLRERGEHAELQGRPCVVASISGLMADGRGPATVAAAVLAGLTR